MKQKQEKVTLKQDELANEVKKQINIIPIIIVLAIIASLCVALVMNPEGIGAGIANVKTSAITILSPFYLWLGFAAVVYLLYFSFSKYGNVRFGNEKPQYSTFSWAAMMFCAGMGSSLLYWSALEWIYYYSGPPMGAEPFSQFAAELSMAYGNFHWSITAWALYCVGAISLGWRYYVRKKPGLNLTACCEGAIGEKVANGIVGKIIEIIFVFGILGGLATTFALGVPMISSNLSTLTGITDSFTLKVIIMAIIAAIFALTSWIGLEKGMKTLSNINTYLALGLAFFVLFAGPTLFEIKSFTNSLGYIFQNYIHMSLWTDFVGNGGFPEGWTGFYWAWWLSLGPWMWIFIAKISRGRTIRQVALGTIIFGSAGCWLYFGTVSSFGLYQQLNGVLDLVNILNTQGPTIAISSLVLSLPMGVIILVLWMILAILFLATTMDSAAFTLAAATTKNLGENDSPTRGFKLFWAAILTVVPLSFMFANASLTALQSLAVLTAVPIAVLAVLSMISGIKYANNDYGKFSAAEIIKMSEVHEVDVQGEEENNVSN